MKREFDACLTPLEKGFTAIEASAGTGKTTTVCAVVLRMIVEYGIPIEKILVTTYTELATAELRGRIRQVIVEALHCAQGEAAGFPFVGAIVEKAKNRTELTRRLDLARHNFDEAPIFTIHGFCARVLSERAFESGILFETQLTTDQSGFLRDVVDDFWRIQFYGDDPIVSALIRNQITPEHLTRLLEQLSNNPRLCCVPVPENLAMLKCKLLATSAERPDCDELIELTNRLIVALQSRFFEWARTELPGRKKESRVQSFDDLLTQLDEALHGSSGEQLRNSLRQRFPVAIIDEFQDTDPVQYSIFSHIYRDSNCPVFLIGDPKQAIYGFRGADVFTYLHAAELASRRYTLAKNWRSEAKLVEGVSAIFGHRKGGFVIPGIDLVPVKASGTADAEPMTLETGRDQPLRFWIASADDRAERMDAVAGEIADLLTSEAKIGQQRVKPRDIAVLVTNNSQPAEIQRALSRYKIPSVVYSAANVFKSPEAEELMCVLLAVAQPTREAIVRAALATEMLGFAVSGLARLSTDEAQWEEILNRFADYQSEWRDRGFVEMMRTFIVREKIRVRLLRLPDGERRLTNLLHLIELLHAACAQHRLGIEGIIAWFARQMSDASPTKEEYELRLESDEDAVRIVTIHKSKGLEYPVTFYPFARKEPWRGGKEFLTFHRGDELVLDLAESPDNKEVRAQEELSESVRQLYVGLTRARHRSYVVWDERRQRSKSALAWLFSDESSADAFLKRGASDTGQMIRSAFTGSDTVAVENLPRREIKLVSPKTPEAKTLEPRIFNGWIDRGWGIASFSSMVSGKAQEPETPDYDSTEILIETEPVMPAQGIHAFPGGTRAGTCLHKILEKIDFSDRGQWAPVVSEKLAQFHISGFDEVVFDTIARIQETPLTPCTFRFGDVSARLHELEFMFPMDLTAPGQLQELFETNFPEAIGDLKLFPAQGYMKGFIDLVFEYAGKFYFADWKSNWLGPDASFYTSENLAESMADNFYFLQLSIYALALHRYLKRRLTRYDYEEHFGGAFYVFLRGNEAPGRGIYHQRPDRLMMEKLDRIFSGAS